MTRAELIDDLQARFREEITDFSDKSPKRIYVGVAPESLPRVAAHLFRVRGARFHIASGMDARSHLEILYHFSVESLNLLISLRVRVDKGDPVVPSLTPVIRGAAWIEREMHELLGIDFQGHPDPSRLLLDGEWPRGVFPLRREYREWDPKAVRDRGV